MCIYIYIYIYMYGIQNQKHFLSSTFQHFLSLSFSKLIYTQITFEKFFYNFFMLQLKIVIVTSLLGTVFYNIKIIITISY